MFFETDVYIRQLGPLGALLEKEAWIEESCIVGVLESYSMDVEDLGAYATGSGFGVWS